MGRNIYVCARLPQAISFSQQIIDDLARHFGTSHVFGVQRLQPASLRNCDAVVVLIDSSWLGGLGSRGLTFLSDPADPIRLILLVASQQGMLIVPVLLGNAKMPSAEDLPEVLRFLHYRNALTIRYDARWAQDASRVWRELEAQIHGRNSFIPAFTYFAVGSLWWGGFAVLSIIASFTHLVPLQAFFSQMLLVWLLAYGPLLVFCTEMAVRMLRIHRTGVGAALLLCVVASLEEILRPATMPIVPVELSNAFVPWLISYAVKPLLLVTLAAMICILVYIVLRPSSLTYGFRFNEQYRHLLSIQHMQDEGVSPGIYISCRPADKSETYEAIRAHLSKHVSRNGVLEGFADAVLSTDDLPPGRGHDVAERVEGLLQRSISVFVLIGPHWLSALGVPDRDRVAFPDVDPVREEIRAALLLGKLLTPVLIDGATLPATADLPPELAILSALVPICQCS